MQAQTGQSIPRGQTLFHPLFTQIDRDAVVSLVHPGQLVG